MDWEHIKWKLRSPDYKVPEKEIKTIIKRAKKDPKCIYCRVNLIDYKKGKWNREEIEHIYNEGGATAKNVALCCHRCNCSKSNSLPRDWFDSPGFKKREINENNFAKVVKDHWLVCGRS